MLEAPHLEVQQGEPLTLNCVMSLNNESWQPLVIWQQNSRLISFDRVARVHSRKIQSKSGKWFMHSQLQVHQADLQHSGQFGCRMTAPGLSILSDLVHVHVLAQGQRPTHAKHNYNQLQKAAFSDLDLSSASAPLVLSAFGLFGCLMHLTFLRL